MSEKSDYTYPPKPNRAERRRMKATPHKLRPTTSYRYKQSIKKKAQSKEGDNLDNSDN